MATRSVSFHLGLLVLIAAAPLMALAVGLLLWNAALTRQAVDRELMEAVDTLGTAVGREIDGWTSALYALAAEPSLDCAPTQRFYDQATTVGQRHGARIVLIDVDGRQRMNTLRPFGAPLPNVPNPPVVRDAFRVDQPVISDLFIGAISNAPVVFVAVPVPAGARPVCWLAMGMAPERFDPLLALQGRPSWRGALVDARHAIVVNSGKREDSAVRLAPDWYIVASGKHARGIVEGAWHELGARRVAFQRLNAGRWTVAVAAPSAELALAWRAPVAAGAAGLLLIVVISLALAGIYARRMKRETGALAQLAARLGGDAPAALPPPGSVAELDVLRAALSRADEDIRQRRVEHEAHMASEALRAAAESASRSKDLFLATLSHELRGPLTAVIGWLDVGRFSLGDAGMLRQCLDIAMRNAKQQARIIDDLLDVSRIVSGKFSVERRPLELSRLAEEVVEACRPAAAEKPVELRCRVTQPAFIEGDRERMFQVLSNLIGNAIKFSRPGGWVEVALDCAGVQVRLEVSDNGEGIAADALPHVFERFWQGNASGARKHAGLGLGLSLVRYIVELHAGRIEAESAGPGQGSRFTVTLPRLAVAPERLPGSVAQAQDESEPA
ncbi:MAG TPA: HAMP domain-containing sensor histidine kinase, partial [Burkholderiales bacterium]|nr:HAMP domain-containing sensor histidine kinase [Burkholderiales bacterium]